MENKGFTTELNLNEKVASEVLKLAEYLKAKAAEGVGWEKLLQTAEAGVYEICMSLDLQNVHDFKETLSVVVGDLREHCKQYSGWNAVPSVSAFPCFEQDFYGFERAAVYVIDGIAQERFSTFVAPMIEHIAITNKQPTAFISYGYPTKRLFNEWLIKYSQTDRQKFYKGMLNRDQWDRMDSYVGTIVETELFSSDERNFSMVALCACLRSLCREHSIQVAVLSDLMEFLGFCPSQMDYSKLNSLMIDLKRLAQELNIPIVILSHLSYPDMPVSVGVHMGFDQPFSAYPRIKRDYLH